MPRPGRLFFFVLACASLATLIVSAWTLANRIERWNETNGRQLYYFFPINTTLFTFNGSPVEITDELDEQGNGEVLVSYAGETLRVPVSIPNDLPLPGLARHSSWLRFNAFGAPEKGQSFEDFRAALDEGRVRPRLVAVVRTPHAEPTREGNFDLETEEDWGWGEVRRDRWVFTFHEFLPGGGWRSETLRFPESGNAFYRRQVKAEREGLPPPTRRDDELKEGTWQLDAAIPLMNRPPSITNEQQALRSAGWTLPVASVSVVVLMVSLAFGLAPRRTTRAAPEAAA